MEIYVLAGLGTMCFAIAGVIVAYGIRVIFDPHF